MHFVDWEPRDRPPDDLGSHAMDLVQTKTRKRTGRLVVLLATVAAVAAPAMSAGPAGTITPVSCPGFSVLHNDRIGAAVLPAGEYMLTVEPSANLSCATASKLFARFLEDYDGVLPAPWRVVGDGSGKASFNQGGKPGFSVSRSGSGGGEEGGSQLGTLCRNSFTVNSDAVVGPLTFPQGSYLLYVPPRSGISCNRTSVLFTRFLGAGGPLPFPWRLKNQTATFFKPEHPVRSSFRVEPATGSGGSGTGASGA
jgi:hypothetical protein